MPAKTPKIEELRELSSKIDDLYGTGKDEEGKALLDEALNLSRKLPAYHLFFQGEYEGYINNNHSKRSAFFKDALELEPDDFFLLRNLGVSLLHMGRDEEAIDWFKKALAIKPDDYNSMRGLGVSLSRMGRYEEAIDWYDKALAIKPDDYQSMNNRGVSLSRMGRDEEAIDWYDKALAVKPDDRFSLRNKAVTLDILNRLQDATDAWDKFFEHYPDDVDSLVDHGSIRVKLNRYEEALSSFTEALKKQPDNEAAKQKIALVKRLTSSAPIKPDESRLPKRPLIQASGRVYRLGAEEKQGTLGLRSPEPPQFEELILYDAMKKVWGMAAEKKDDYLAQSRNAAEKNRKFLTEPSKFDPECIFLLGLRKWNSYTPVLPPSNIFSGQTGEDRSVGGGYFLYYKGEGIVIDPGFNFLENFHAMGGQLRDIHHVFVTHAHNDHTNDLESILTLFYQRKKESKNAAEKVDGAAEKVVGDNGQGKICVMDSRQADLYLNLGAFQKFSHLLGLRSASHIGRVRAITADEEYALVDGLKVRVLKAYHDETLTKDYSVGLLFTMAMPDGKEKTLLFTSDTGYVPENEKGAPNALREIWREYAIKRPDFLIPHLGSIAHNEFTVIDNQKEFDKKVAERKVFYDNHLGFMGTAMLIRNLEPRHVFLSEFGEELKGILPELVTMLRDSIGELQCRQPESFLPMDRVFLCDLDKEKIYSLIAESFIPLAGSFFGKLETPDLFHYYNEDCAKNHMDHNGKIADEVVVGRLKTLESFLSRRDKLFFRREEEGQPPNV